MCFSVHCCIEEITSCRLSAFSSLQIRCPRSAGRLLFDRCTSSSSSPAPLLGLVPLSWHGKVTGAPLPPQIWLHFTCHAVRKIVIHELTAERIKPRGSHVHEEEDGEDPRGDDFKAICLLSRDREGVICVLLSRKATGHTCVCECIMYCMSGMYVCMSEEKSYNSLSFPDLNLHSRRFSTPPHNVRVITVDWNLQDKCICKVGLPSFFFLKTPHKYDTSRSTGSIKILLPKERLMSFIPPNLLTTTYCMLLMGLMHHRFNCITVQYIPRHKALLPGSNNTSRNAWRRLDKYLSIW